MISDTHTELHALLEQGRVAAAAGDSFAARTAYRRAAEIDPACAMAWLGLGACATALVERRSCFARALELDPESEAARAGLAEVDAWLEQGLLLAPVARPAPRQSAPPTLSAVVAQAPALAPARPLAFAVAGLLCLLTMATLTMLGALIFTSVVGYVMAFIVGPLVGELMLRLVDWIKPWRGRAAQIALGAAVGLGGLAALAFGGTLLPAAGLPLTADTLAMAQAMGAANAASALLFHPAMVVFVGASVAGTVYRLKQ